MIIARVGVTFAVSVKQQMNNIIFTQDMQCI